MNLSLLIFTPILKVVNKKSECKKLFEVFFLLITQDVMYFKEDGHRK